MPRGTDFRHNSMNARPIFVFTDIVAGIELLALECLLRHRASDGCQPCLRVGKSFLHVLQHWSVQPYVRPFDAVHVTAGHNALRGSGPDQTPAFDTASTQVGCPDRQIDRLCITCCSPSQASHHAGCPARSRLSRNRDGFLVSLAPSHHGPDHSRDLIGKRYCGNLRRPPNELTRCA